MKAFAVIRNEPSPCKNYLVSVQQKIDPKLVVNALKTEQPKKSNVHIIDLRKSARISEQQLHVLQSASPNREQKQIEIVIDANEEKPIEQTAEKKFKGERKRPIFQKTTIPRQARPDDQTISAISSIKINSSREEIDEEEEIFFTSANHRRMKGEQKPYAPTHRTKAEYEMMKQKEAQRKQNLQNQQSRPVRRKLFQSPGKEEGQKDNFQITKVEKSAVQNPQHSFKKRNPIFAHAQKKHQMVESQIVHEASPEDIQESNDQMKGSSQKSKQEGSRIIKLHPRDSKKQSSNEGSDQKQQSSSGEGSRVIKLQPKESKKCLGESRSEARNSESQISISVISRTPMGPFML